MPEAESGRKARGWLLVLKVGVAVLVGLTVFTFVPGRFVPAFAAPGYEKLVTVRRAIGVRVRKAVGRRQRGGPATGSPPPKGGADASVSGRLTVCSVCVPDLGGKRQRDHRTLAGMLCRYDIVTVQGLTAPPYPMRYPDGTAARPAAAATAFFDAMRDFGFHHSLSAEDTGPGQRHHRGDASTEWFVTFFRPEKVSVATDLPSGFLAPGHAGNRDFDRVPHAFAFRTVDGRLDFVLVAVRQSGGSGPLRVGRRKHELHRVADWVAHQSGGEYDFLIVGHMGFDTADELVSAVPLQFTALDSGGPNTRVDVDNPRPEANVLYRPAVTSEVDRRHGLAVISPPSALPPGSRRYDLRQTRERLTPNRPVVFRLNIPWRDDD